MSEDSIRRLSTGELFRRLVNNLSALVDREVDLAKQEARQDAIQAATGVSALTVGLVMLYTCLAALIVAATLAVVYAVWATTAPVIAALVVAGVFLLLGFIAAGIGFLRIRLRPLERTRQTVREDVEWARRRAR